VLAVLGVAPAGVKVVGPVQSNVAPLVEELPVSVTLVNTQVIIKSGPADTLGAIRLVPTTTVLVFVQPLTGLVTVSVYVPATVTVPTAKLFGVIAPGPVHPNVVPPVEELPVKVTVGLAQVIVCGAPAFAFGGVRFVVTTTVALAVHVVAVLVTVKV
jgi:hypothetical protein